MTLGWTLHLGVLPSLLAFLRIHLSIQGYPPSNQRPQVPKHQYADRKSGRFALRLCKIHPESLRSYRCRYRGFYAGSPTIPPSRQHCKQRQATLVPLPPCETRVSGAAYNPHNPSETPTMGTRSKQTTCDPGSKSLLSSIDAHPHD